MDTENVINYWSAYMRAQHCTERTIKERSIFIRSLLRRTAAESVLTMTKEQLVMFLGRPELNGKTKQNYRSTLHTFFTWMQDEGLRLDNPAARLPRPRVEQREANPVSTEDLQRVLNSNIYGATLTKFLLYAYQGLRASEIAAVHGSSIDWERRTILTLEGKGRKEVTRPLHSVIYEHAIANDLPRDDWWFPGQAGAHVRGNSVSNVLCAAIRRAGVTGHTAHDMRKWMGTTMIEAGADSRDVQWALRHTDPQSMKAYLKPPQDRIRTAMELLPRVEVPMRPKGRTRLHRAPRGRPKTEPLAGIEPASIHYGSRV